MTRNAFGGKRERNEINRIILINEEKFGVENNEQIRSIAILLLLKPHRRILSVVFHK